MISPHRVQIGQTIANLWTPPQYLPSANKSICHLRQSVADYIRRHPEFYYTLKPFPDSGDCKSEIIRRMIDAAALAQVGPMAAVAGVIADIVVHDLVEQGAPYAIMDNGGDIALYLAEPITIGLYTGRTVSTGIGLRIEQCGRFFALCTSSRVIGHSLSFGITDCASIWANDGAVADAFATALGNALTSPEIHSLQDTLNKFLDYPILGCIAVIQQQIGFAGELPEFCEAEIDSSLIAQ